MSPRTSEEAFVIKGRRWALVGVVAIASVVVGVGVVAATTRHPAGRGATAVSAALSLAPVIAVTTAAAPLPTTPPAGPAPTSTRPTTATTQPKALVKTKPKAKAQPQLRVSKPQPAKRTTSSPASRGTGRIQYGVTHTGAGTFYAADGGGNCSYDASSDLMVGAMNQQDYDNSQSCGAYLAVTGPSGQTITIRVVDRCPECPPGAIDLSRQAFAKLAPVSVGKIKISWRLLSPALSGPVAYRYKSGSSKYWCGIQVLNHRNPITALQVRIGNGWKTLTRQTYNYFLSTDGAGCGGTIRITDLYGQRLTDTGIAISPDVVQRGHAQLGPPA